ncbi:RINT-1 family protein [Amylostereum chailletii]|nr:RINT-1 family protein [Amylostereum chailletii]
MSAAFQIQQYLQPPDEDTSTSRALGILNSECNTSSDINLVVLKAQAQRDYLQQSVPQLSTSQTRIDALLSESRSIAAVHLHTAQELSLLRHSLADELTSLTEALLSALSEEETAPTLLEDIEMMHRNLKEQESIKGYVQVIHRALTLSEAAVRQALTTDPVSLSEYTALRAYISTVSHVCSKVSDVTGQSDTTLRIVTYLEEICMKTWDNMKSSLSAKLIGAAEPLKWPMPVDWKAVTQNDRAAFAQAFHNLLAFQQMGEQIHGDGGRQSEGVSLYAIQALVHPIALRFKYHFEGIRQTNKLDKPEWYFTHVLNVSHEHRAFMESTIQGLLSHTPYRDVDAWREFTANLFPLLTRRLNRSMSSLLARPSLLAHTIYQALAFDASLREEGFSPSGTISGRSADTKEWEGISSLVLERKEWFDRWLDAEKIFAMDQYNEIISAPDAWTVADEAIDGQDGDSSETELRPTVSARRLKALVEQVTDRYSPLPQFGQRMRFLISVQLPLLESYHDRISSSLDAFESLSSVFVRAVPGALGAVAGEKRDVNRLTSGSEGVIRLCKALVSAKCVRAALEAWGEDLASFFLEMWMEINHKASLRVRAETHPLLPDPKASTSEAPEGTIFEVLMTQYSKLAIRAEDMTVQLVCGEVESHLKAYFIRLVVTFADDEASPSDIAVSPTLLPALASFSAHIFALRRALPQTTTMSLYRRIVTRLSMHIVQRAVLYRRAHHITLDSGRLLQGECELWLETARQALSMATTPRSRIEAPWRRLLQAVRVVGAEGERWQSLLNTTFGTMSDVEWGEKISELVGGSELTREEVCIIARTRTDCSR